MGASGDVLQLGIDVEANADAARQVDLVTAALAKFRQEAGNLGQNASGANLGAQVNIAIGAFQRLGQTIDVTNARAVTGFALMGEELTANLARLGATEAELSKIGASVIKVQQAAGAAGLGTFLPASLGPNLTGTAFATRRAADAVASMSLAAQSGKVSMQALSLGVGSIVTDVTALAGASLGLATVLGAVVTVGTALVGVLTDIGGQSKKAEAALKSLREEAEKQATAEALRGKLTETNAALEDALKRRASLQSDLDQKAAALRTAPGFGAAAAASQVAEQLRAEDARIKALRAQQADVTAELNKKGLSAAKEIAEAKIRFDNEAKEASIRASQGEFAARRAAANDEFENEKRKLKQLETAKGQSNDAIAALERAHQERLRSIDADEAQKLATVKLTADTKSIKTREETELSSHKTTLEKTEAELQSSLATRAITETQFIAARLTAQKAAIQADTESRLKAANDVLQKEQEAAAATRGPEGSQKALDALQKFGDERERILAEQRQRIGAAENAANGPAALTADLQRRRTAIFADLQSNIRETQALAESGAISESDAQKRVIAAYQATQTQLATLIVQYEQLAEAEPKNDELARTVQDLNAQYLELGNTISRLRDPFRALKDTAEQAGQAALSDFISGVTKLGSQSHVEINALAGELANARQELDQLLAIPANERTSNQTARITELRGEVENLTVSLNNSKQAITSWKSLFVDALQSILDAMIKVASEASARGIFRFLSGLLPGGGFGVDAGTGASDFFGVYSGRAAGGLVSGPAGVDRVPSMLTAGEYVVRAPAVAALGTDFMETINRAGFGGSPLALRRIPSHFAGGGLVARSDGGGAPGGSQTRVLIEHTEDYVARVVESPRGEQAILRAVARNPSAISRALGLASTR